MQNTASASQKIRLGVYSIAVVYMLGIGFLYSWWVVPAYKAGDTDVISGAVGFLWSYAVVISTLGLMIGAALTARARGRSILFLAGGWFTVALWQILAPPNFTPPMFGIGGGLIVLFFLGVTWNWTRLRPTLSQPEQIALDLQLFGHVLWVIAAWHICGLLGPPGFALSPDLIQPDMLSADNVPSGSTIMSELALGWAFAFAAQHMRLRARSEGV